MCVVSPLLYLVTRDFSQSTLSIHAKSPTFCKPKKKEAQVPQTVQKSLLNLFLIHTQKKGTCCAVS